MIKVLAKNLLSLIPNHFPIHVLPCLFMNPSSDISIHDITILGKYSRTGEKEYNLLSTPPPVMKR